MSNYAESHLNKNEEVILKAEKNILRLCFKLAVCILVIVAFIIIGVVAKDKLFNSYKENLMKDPLDYYMKQLEYGDDLGFGLLKYISFIPLVFASLFCIIKSIRDILEFINTELAVTNRRVIGKVGIINTKSLDAPLNKIQNISASNGLWGKIFNAGTVIINTAAGEFKFHLIKNIDAFKSAVMNQIEEYEQSHIREQAEQMANAMSKAIKQ